MTVPSSLRGPSVDAGPVRAHIRDLLDAGLRQVEIARAAGIRDSSVFILLHGRPGRPLQQQVRSDIAERLLAVPIPEGAPCDHHGTR